MPSPVDLDVLAANQCFYDSFARRDADAMEALWARTAPVACIHPGWGALRGRSEVMASWVAILAGGDAPRVACTAATAHVMGDSAFVVCEERMSGGRLVATNVFVREDGGWKMVHHQAGPMATGDEVDELDDDDDEPAPVGSPLN